TNARCSNASCGHVTRLVDDPLGRIFRCPRCLTKLPTAPAMAADSGWKAIRRPSLRTGGRSTSDREVRPARVRSASRARSHPAAVAAGVDSWGGVALVDDDPSGFVGGYDFDEGSAYGLGSDPAFRPDESGEVLVEPMSQPGSLASGWSAASMPGPVSASTLA